MKIVTVNKVPIELYKIIKFEKMVSNVPQAQAVIAEGKVKLNGVTETQKRKLVRLGDVIEFKEFAVKIALKEASSTPAKPVSKLKAKRITAASKI